MAFGPRRHTGWLDSTTPPHITTLVATAGIAALNMNIFMPSLPSMATYFDSKYATVQLAISAYLGVSAVLQIIIGPLSDRFGRRPVMLWGLVIFLFATIGCIVAPNIETLLTFRMIQTAVGAGMVLSRAVVRDMVPPAQAASKIGYLTMGMALVPMIGPAMGGMLDAAFGWQASFGMVLVLGLLVLALAWHDLGETNSHKSASFGAQFRAYPALIKSRRFWGYTFTAGFSSGAFFAFLGGAPYVSTQVLGLQSQGMGLYFALVSGGYMVGNFMTGRLAARIGINNMMLLGTMLAVFGTGLSALLFGVGLVHPLSLYGPMFIVGMGNGLTLPNANAGIVSVRPELAGSASGLGSFMLIGSGAALSAITGAMLGPAHPVAPLLGMMVGVSIAAVLAALSVIVVAKRAAELGESGFAD